MWTKKKIETIKPYWLIVRQADPKGYHTGKAYDEINLFEFDTATELELFDEENQIESSESPGDYLYIVKAQSHDWEAYESMAEEENNEKQRRID